MIFAHLACCHLALTIIWAGMDDVAWKTIDRRFASGPGEGRLNRLQARGNSNNENEKAFSGLRIFGRGGGPEC